MKLFKLSIYLLLLLVGFNFSCGSSGKVAKKSSRKTQSGGVSGMREDFNPVDLNDDDPNLIPDVASSENTSDNSESVTGAPVDSIGTGYRIQIIQTTDPEEARTVQQDAILRFDHEIYRVFNPPYYKVRVGDFVNWTDAEKVQDLAIRKGFREAWVIRTKVNLKKAYKDLNEW